MTFNNLFLLELGDIYSAEQQIINSLPEAIRACTSIELKEALSTHLEETKEQFRRLRRIFSILDEQPHGEECEAMEGLLREVREICQEIPRSAVRDAGIIGALQKVEHYEISAYGTLYSHAKQLDYEREILNLINDSLDEESAADEKLSKLAEGSFFTAGINQEAIENYAGMSHSHRSRR